MTDPQIAVERARTLAEDDLHALTEAATAAIIDGGGFGWVKPPERGGMARYFQGVLQVPERELFLARLDGVVVGAAQLVRAPRNNEAQAFAATLMHAFIAPYARGAGLGRMLTMRVEERARGLGLHVLNLDLRETQVAAIRLYEELGFQLWGTHPAYALVGGQMLRGFYYTKKLRAPVAGRADVPAADALSEEA